MAPVPRNRRSRYFCLATCALIVICAIAIPVGVVYSNKHSNTHNASVSSQGSGSGSGGAAGVTRTNGSALAPKAKWDFSKNKMSGVNLGNWLVLERWMDEDNFVARSSPDCWDEWSFTAQLGSGAASVLEDHWNTWITEGDLDTLRSAGINTLRIPMGFWAWIPTQGNEPYVTNGQIAQLERVCQYAYDRDMYIILDMHGLPGSQNGEQQSGHNTTNPTFYQPLQQARSDALIKAVVDWVNQTQYYSIVAAIEAANEPRPYTDEQFAMLLAFYERSYDTIQSLPAEKRPAMMFADGFYAGDKFAYWWDFAAARVTSPPSLVLTDHPYPGYPNQTARDDILQQVCTDAAKYQNFPVPTCITEWSLRTGILDTAFEKQLYTYQITAWSWFAGSTFWSIRAKNSTLGVLADSSGHQYQWSYEDLLARGSIPTPSGNETTEAFIAGLGSPCGTPLSLSPSATRTGASADVARASASVVAGLVASVESVALQTATAYGYAGLENSAIATGGSAKAAEATVSQGPGPLNRRNRAHPVGRH